MKFGLLFVFAIASLACKFEKGSIESCGLESVSMSPDSDLGTVLCTDTTKNQVLNLAPGNYFITLTCALSSVVQVEGTSKEGTTLTFTQNHMAIETSKLISFENLTLKGSNTYSAQNNPSAKFWLVNADVQDFINSPQSTIKTSQELYVVNSTFKNILGNTLEGAAITASNSSVMIKNTLFQDCSNQKDSLVKVMLSSQLTIENTQVKNFTGKFAGVFEIDEVGSVTINNFNCLNCESTEGSGGAVYYSLSEDFPKLELRDSSFTNCKAKNGKGGSIVINSYNLLIYPEINLSNLTFSNLKAGMGAAIYISELVNFYNKTAKFDTINITGAYSQVGGVIQDLHADGTLEVDNLNVQDSTGYSCGIYGRYIGATESTYHLRVTNSYFENCESDFGGVFIDSLSSKIQVYFEGLKFLNATKGTLLRKVETTIKNAEFIDGSAVQVKLCGGASGKLEGMTFRRTKSVCIEAIDFSYLECTDCLFEENSDFAIKAEANSNFWLDSNRFIDNSAQKDSGVIISSLGNGVSTIKNSVFFNNYALGYHCINAIRSYIAFENITFERNSGDYPAIYTSYSQINISSSNFKDQEGQAGSFLYSTSSRITIEGSSFINGTSRTNGGAIWASDSRISISGSSFSDIEAGDRGGVVYAMINSTVTISNSVFRNTRSTYDGSIIFVNEGYLSLRNCSVYNSSSIPIYTEYARETRITNLVFEDCSGSYASAIAIYESKLVNVEGSSFRNCTTSVDFGGAVYLESVYTTFEEEYQISNCEFINNTSILGGGVYSKNLKLRIENSTFSSNSAIHGGAVYLESPDNKNATFKIYNSSFDSNKASLQGGAIKWDHYRPQLRDVTFTNNSALYGNDLASYPVSMVAVDQKGTPTRNLQGTEYPLIGQSTSAPGQPMEEPIRVALIDQYGSVVSVDNSSEAYIGTQDPGLIVSGKTTQVASKGIFTFDSVEVYGKPSSEVQLEITTSSIDQTKKLSANDTAEYNPKVLFLLALRDCQKGEAKLVDRCSLCEEGTYSLSPEQACTDCPEAAECLGNWTMFPKPGYWRPSEETDKFYNCPNPEACKGSSNYTNYLGTCSKGYEGHMCQVCAKGYTKLFEDSCSECPSPLLNTLRLVGMFVFVVVYNAFQVLATVKSAYEPESLSSVYLKILTNYTQLAYVTTQFKLKWPGSFSSLFSIQKAAVSVFSQLFSVDCLMQSQSHQELVFGQLVAVAVLPVVLSAAAAVVWAVVALKKRDSLVMKRELVASLIVLFFMVHPSLLNTLFSVFVCTEIEGLGSWLTQNLEVQCWDPEHTFYALAVALPGVLVWGIATPFVIVLLIYKRRKYLKRLDNRLRFGFVFNGYKVDKFYWEFVVLYRKTVLLVLAVFLPSNLTAVKALICLLVLVVSLYLQVKEKPFIVNHLNTMETNAVFTATVTIYCGLYYFSGELEGALEVVLLVAITLSNCWFFGYWLRHFLGSYITKALQAFPRIRHLFYKTDGFDGNMYAEDTYRAKGKVTEEGCARFTLLKPKPPKPDPLEGINTMQDLYLEAFKNFKDVEDLKELEDSDLDLEDLEEEKEDPQWKLDSYTQEINTTN